jgi:toxin ParE1/3/4
MAPIVFTAAADADAAAIFDYLYAKAGKSTVLKYRAAFKTLYEHLANFPDSGAPRPKVGWRIRIGIVSPYIVIYSHMEADDIVRVLRIVHGSRRITGKLLRRGS